MRIHSILLRQTAFARFAWHPSLAALLLVTSTAPVHADAINVSVGDAQGITLYAANLQLDRNAPIHRYQSWTLTGHVDLGIGEFRGNRGSSGKTGAFAALGKLRGTRTRSPLFVEFGFGLAAFSDKILGGERKLGGQFTFIELLRSGVRLGDHRQFEIAMFAEHCSNAGLWRVNEGSTSPGVSVSWYFR